MPNLHINRSPVPYGSRMAAGPFLGGSGVLNPGLLFDRYLPWIKKGQKDADQWKQDALEAVAAACNHRSHRGLLSAWDQRWQAMAEAAGAEIFERATTAPLVAGLGRKGAFEIGFSFHRYGFPYLPGSALKGMARTLAFFETLALAGNLDLESLPEADVPKRLRDLEKQLMALDAVDFDSLLQNEWPQSAHASARRFRQVFGHQHSAGQAIFFEAIPRANGDKRCELAIDILNPHYPEYTAGKQLPTNWQDPQPNKFLVVPARQVFRFAVGWRGAADLEALAQAAAWLQRALLQLGAGAKTSAGYGVFAEKAPKEASPTQPAAGPFVDEIVTGSVFDATEPDGYWIWLDGYSSEENGFFAWLPLDSNGPRLQNDDPITAIVQPYGKKLDKTILRLFET